MNAEKRLKPSKNLSHTQTKQELFEDLSQELNEVLFENSTVEALDPHSPKLFAQVLKLEAYLLADKNC